MADTARATRAAPTRRDAVMEAIAFAAERLLLSDDWRRVADDVLDRLGTAAGVSRACVTENSVDEDGRELSTIVAEWCAAGIAPTIGDSAVSPVAWEDGFGRWVPAMLSGQAVVGAVADFPEGEVRYLRAQDILSLAYFPVTVDGAWWGCIGFDDCLGERDWVATDLEGLRTAATLLGAAIQRQRQEERVRAAEVRYRGVVESIPAVTYIDEPTGLPAPEAARVTFVSPQIEEMLGYPAARFTDDATFWFSLMHPEDHLRLEAVEAFSVDDLAPFDEEYRMRHADGRWIWVKDTSTAVLRHDGSLAYFQGFMIDITERKVAEERLRQAQQRLEILIDHMPAVVYVESPDAAPEKFYLSNQVEQLFGYTAEEWTWTEDFWIDRVHPEDRARVVEMDDVTEDDKHPFAADYRFKRADGAYRWVHDEAVFVSTPDGVGYWQGFIFDITARREAEEQLKEAERVLRATVEHLPAVVYRQSADLDEHKQYISPQVDAILGVSAEEWNATPDFWETRLHPDDRTTAMAESARTAATREPYSIDYRFRRGDGTYVWVHDEATFVQEDERREAFWQGFIIDISARKEAEQQVREAELKFRTIVEQNPAIIYTQEFDDSSPSVSRTTYVSPRQTEVFGYTTEEVLSDPTMWARMIHPVDRERVVSADLDTNAGPSDRYSQEYRMLAKDGRVVWVRDEAQLVSIEGRPPFWQGFMLDITERRDAEEQLARALGVEREATKRLRALDEMKNTFLQAVSHDLRTPLAAILGLAITLERGDVHLDEADAKDLARRIADNARRLDRLVMNLLDLDRLARGIVTPKLQPTDIGSLVRRIVAESELIADSRLQTDIQPVVVRADASKVERVIENLLSNTARHAPATSTVWVRVRPDPGGALLLVEDDGPGVAPELRETVFEPFRQGPDAPAHSPGVGVGLTLVRRFAELHGGRAWVEDRDGGGASFRVFLPADPPPAPPAMRSGLGDEPPPGDPADGSSTP
jgi:PAS domain S-box-containing protein